MNDYLLYIFISFIVSLASGLVSIPHIIRYCTKHSLYDLPNARKVHNNSIPRLGGICFLPSMMLAIIVSIIVFNSSLIDNQIHLSLWSVIFFLSLAIIYTVGILDDMIGLNAGKKFLAQIVAASLLPLSGLYFNNLYGFLGIHEISIWIGAPLTVFIIVFINNAINLIDGIDGLSSSLAIIALGGFICLFFMAEVFTYCILIAGLIGVIMAFFYFNVFGKVEKSTKVFMGDSGSLTIGFILGFLAVKYSMDRPDLKFFDEDAIVLAYTLVIVPCFDEIRVSAARFFHHKSAFSADKNHIHHKLMRMGMSQRQTLVALVALALVFIGTNILFTKILDLNINIIVLADIAIWHLFNGIINHTLKKKGLPVFQIDK